MNPPAGWPGVGRIVWFSLPHGHSRAGSTRPAIITIVWSAETVNLHVFHDPANDEPVDPVAMSSVTHDEAHAPGTWRWPARSETPAAPATPAAPTTPTTPISSLR